MALTDHRQHIFPGDAAPFAGADDVGQIDPDFAREPSNGWTCGNRIR
jgi:hypothetical protein